jgi:hypothetical protein
MSGSPADEGHLNRPVLSDELQDARNQSLAMQIAELPQRDGPAQVIVPVRVAARAVERTFAGDFDREQGTVTAKQSSPGCQ